MPIFVAWSTAKKVNTSIPMALLLGALLIDPNILSIVTTGEPFKMYGILSMPLVNYAQTLLPTLLTVWVLQYVFKFLIMLFQNHLRLWEYHFVHYLS